MEHKSENSNSSSVAQSVVKFSPDLFFMMMTKCMDSCVTNFDNKILDISESTCIEECGEHLAKGLTSFNYANPFTYFQDEKAVRYALNQQRMK